MIYYTRASLGFTGVTVNIRRMQPINYFPVHADVQCFFYFYDVMHKKVGQYVDAVENSGNGYSFDKNTWIFLTSDHGDMRMEHQQFYKMVPWEASSRVPLVVVGPGIKQGGAVHTQPTSLLDIYPTMLELTGFSLPKTHTGLDGYSLMPLLTTDKHNLDPQTGVDSSRPAWVVSQGHMADNAMSWYLIRDG